MKKPLLQTLFICILATVIYAITWTLNISKDLPQQARSKPTTQSWQKITKTKIGISTTKASKTEQIKYQLTRKPASTNPILRDKNLYRAGRKLIGENLQQYLDPQQKLNMQNSINPAWPTLLANELARFQKSDTKIFLKKLDTYIKIENGNGRYLELVLISYHGKNSNSSFNASIDSATGAIVSTWNRTIHENSKISPLKFTVEN